MSGKLCARTSARATSLPPELLSHIFRALAKMYPILLGEPKAESHQEILRVLGWIVVTHVCKSWRWAALATPSLWTGIRLAMGKSWSEEMALRSRTVPRTLVLNMMFTPPVGDIAFIPPFTAAELPRAKTISMVFCNFLHRPSLPHDVLSSLVVPAPHLGKLDICSNAMEGWLGDQPTRFVPHPLPQWPEHAFNDNAPRLRYISLFGVELGWKSRPLKFPSLEVLDISYPSHTSEVERPTLPQLLDVLAHLPKLKTLALRGCFPSPAQPSLRDNAISTAELGQLRELSLAGSAVECRQLLGALTFPPTCSLSFDIFNAPNESLQSITSYFADSVHRGRAQTLQACRMYLASGTTATFEGWRRLPEPFNSDTAALFKKFPLRHKFSKPDIKLHFNCNRHNLPEPHDLFRAFPTQDIRLVAFKLNHLLKPPSPWEKTVNDWPAAEHLVVELAYIASLLRILAYRSLTPSPLPGPRRIASVRLWGDAYERKKALPSGVCRWDDGKSWEEHLESLHTALRHRMKPGVLGWNIEEIILDGWEVSDKWLENLRAVVREVVVEEGEIVRLRLSVPGGVSQP